jgi:hypothetical protein
LVQVRMIVPHYISAVSIPRPRLFIYDLPPEFTSWFDVKKLKEPLEAAFFERVYSSGEECSLNRPCIFLKCSLYSECSPNGP